MKLAGSPPCQSGYTAWPVRPVLTIALSHVLQETHTHTYTARGGSHRHTHVHTRQGKSESRWQYDFLICVRERSARSLPFYLWCDFGLAFVWRSLLTLLIYFQFSLPKFYMPGHFVSWESSPLCYSLHDCLLMLYFGSVNWCAVGFVLSRRCPLGFKPPPGLEWNLMFYFCRFVFL